MKNNLDKLGTGIIISDGIHSPIFVPFSEAELKKMQQKSAIEMAIASEAIEQGGIIDYEVHQIMMNTLNKT